MLLGSKSIAIRIYHDATVTVILHQMQLCRYALICYALFVQFICVRIYMLIGKWIQRKRM